MLRPFNKLACLLRPLVEGSWSGQTKSALEAQLTPFLSRRNG